MTITPELLLYRVPATEPDGVTDVPERLRPFLDACARCADGDLHSPASIDRRSDRVVASYECEAGHTWTRGHAA